MIMVLATASLATLACALSGIREAVDEVEDASTQAAGLAEAAPTQSAEQPEAPPDTAPEVIDACTLLTDAEIEAVLDGTVSDTLGTNTSGRMSCIYELESGGDAYIAVTPAATVDDAQKHFAFIREAAAAESTLEDLPGPWTEGFWDPALGGSLWVQQGRYVVQVSAADDQQITVQLTTTLIERLP